MCDDAVELLDDKSIDVASYHYDYEAYDYEGEGDYEGENDYEEKGDYEEEGDYEGDDKDKNVKPDQKEDSKTEEKPEPDKEIAGQSQAKEVKSPKMAGPSKRRKKFLRKKELKKLAKGAKTATTLDEEIIGKLVDVLSDCSTSSDSDED